jgi:hypothetical protein
MKKRDKIDVPEEGTGEPLDSPDIVEDSQPTPADILQDELAKLGYRLNDVYSIETRGGRTKVVMKDKEVFPLPDITGGSDK